MSELLSGDYDVVTLGETMIRFTPSGHDRFEQSPSVEVHVGGSESNTAVGLSRLGHRVAWLSRLTNSPMGRLISSSIAAHGVDVSKVIWTDNDRVGTFYLERGVPPRDTQVDYDRANSAASRMAPDDLPTNLFKAGNVRFFHTTGITLGISSSAAKTALLAARLAKSSGAQISFDTNYRAKLWTPHQAKQACEEMLQLADIMFLPRRDAKVLFGIESTNVQTICEQLHQKWPHLSIVMTLGSLGASAVSPQGNYHHQPAFPATEIERVGGGDAFSAGCLSGLIDGFDLPSAIRWGAAAASIKYTISGDIPFLDREMVAALVDRDDLSQSGSIVR